MVLGRHRRSDIGHFEYDSLLELVDDELLPEPPFEQAYDFSSYSIGELLRYSRDAEVSRRDKYEKITQYALWGQENPASLRQLQQAFPRIVQNMKLAHNTQIDLDAVCELESAMQYILDRMNVN